MVKLVSRVTINFPADFNAIVYLKKIGVNLANECPTLDDINWDNIATWSIMPWQLETQMSRDNICDQIKKSYETDRGGYRATKEHPVICDILKLELFNPETRQIVAEKSWLKRT